MRYRVKGKQENSKMCFVCGLKNPAGLRACFYELDGGELLARFRAGEEHQGYPGRLHGGIAAAILDETIGRVIMRRGSQTFWFVTLEFGIRYRKPIPLGEELRARGRLGGEKGRIFEGSGEILLPDGSVAAEGWGKYLKTPLEGISGLDSEQLEWRVVSAGDDPAEVEL